MKVVRRCLLLALILCAGLSAAKIFASAYNLSIAPSGNNVVVTWPAAANGFVLQSTTNLLSPNWQTVTNSVNVLSEATNQVTYNRDRAVVRIFRLFLGNQGFYLYITRSNNTVILSWPVTTNNYTLQSTVGIKPASWQNVVVPAPIAINNTNYVTYTNDWLNRCFRLALFNNTVAPAGMVQIPAGAFTMGNVTGDTDLTDADPTNVNVSAFFMDTNLVSYTLWQSVYAYATSTGYNFDNGGTANFANHPVQTINWYDAVKWCNARSQQAGLTPAYYTDATLTQAYTNNDVDNVYVNWSANGYRLPTEAEWERAARGGLSGKRFPLGDTISGSQANYYGDPDDYPYDQGPYGENPAFFVSNTSPYTSPVGYFGPNAYGLYDMAGNVCEWCWDWYGTPYAGGTDPHGPNNGAPGTTGNRTLRGGYWGYFAYLLRCADRNQTLLSSSPSYAYYGNGFRCVRAH